MRKGQGVTQNYNKAFEMYVIGSQARTCQTHNMRLGVMYENGHIRRNAKITTKHIEVFKRGSRAVDLQTRQNNLRADWLIIYRQRRTPKLQQSIRDV